MAVRIFLHAWRMVFNNLGNVAKIAMPVIVVALLAMVLLGGVIMNAEGREAEALGAAGLIIVPLGIAYIVALLWTAVAWHRYCLLAEYPGGVLPVFHGDRVLSYLGHTLLLAIIIGLSGAAAIGISMALLSGMGLSGVAIVLVFVIIFVIGLVGLRLGIILPAAAIGEPLRIGDAWSATQPMVKTSAVLLLLLFLFGLAISAVGAVLSAISPVLGVFVQAMLGLLQMLMNLSILTTLYGIAIQGRDID